MPSKDAANWVAHPEDLTTVLQFLHSQKSRAGEGGNFDKTVFSEAAAHMAANCPPKKGGPKTADSIAQKWKGCKKLHERILQLKQKIYPGASGWTYTDELGFNVTDDTRDTWNNFVKAHPHFKDFATCGWIHFQVVDEIVPSRALGRHVFNAGATQSQSQVLGASFDLSDDEEASQSN
ncbi:hypothetical protein C8J57DRAFT_1526725 [Mycena rebaudengoi]|nr:hypothetical protein C8J57DRAFT_1526725 [Mycena rebaudengoi]